MARFQPGAVLPSQMGDRYCDPGEGCRRLMLAVLEEAVSTFQKYISVVSGPGGRLYREADAWFRSGDRSWLFSFERICETLDLDSSYIRRGLQEWKERHGAYERGECAAPPERIKMHVSHVRASRGRLATPKAQKRYYVPVAERRKIAAAQMPTDANESHAEPVETEDAEETELS